MCLATEKAKLDATAAAVYARLGEPEMQAELGRCFSIIEEKAAADIEAGDYGRRITRLVASIGDTLDEDLEHQDLLPEERAYLQWLAVRRVAGMSRFIGLQLGTVQPNHPALFNMSA